MKLTDIRIGYKILGIILIFGLSSIGTTVWQSSSVKEAQKDYQSIVMGTDPALVAVARMNQQPLAAMAAAYRLAFETCPSDACSQAHAGMEKAHDNFSHWYDEAVRHDSGHQADLAGFRDRFEALYARLDRNFVPLALKDDDSDATRNMLKAIDDEIGSLRNDLKTYTEGRQQAGQAEAADLEHKIDANARNGLILSLVVVVAITLVAVWLAFGDIARMLGRITAQMQAIAGGNLAQAVDGQDRGDEIGQIARTLGVFKDGLADAERLRGDAEARKAEAEAEQRRAMLALADSFETSVLGMVSAVASASTELEASATTLTHTAQQTTEQSKAVSMSAEESAMNVQTVASATEEMSASISEIANQAAQSAQVAKAAEEMADRTGTVVRDLSQAADKIGNVVALIQNIAAQTNLLALNATIEAARAGEAGKGFAVVATEVKDLASQTAKATSEIVSQIASVQNATGDTVAAIGEITRTIGEISGISAAISAAVEEQMATVHEIGRSTADVATASTDVSERMVGLLSGAMETGSAAEQSLGAAQELGGLAERLSGEVNRFLQTVRAA